MGFPANLIVGDSATWSDDPFLVDGHRYDSGTYALKYELRGPGQPITLTAVANGQGWKTALSATVSAGLAAGTWFWVAVLTATGERVTIARGEVAVAADLVAAGANFDGRSIAEQSLADAEAALANLTKSGRKVGRYTIGNRSAQNYTPAELVQAISYWRLRVANERQAKDIADGLGNPKNLYVRFR